MLERRQEHPREVSDAMSVEAPVRVAPASHVTLTLAQAVTGLSIKSMEARIARGVWLQGKEYHRAPDGRIFVDLRGYALWVESGRASK